MVENCQPDSWRARVTGVTFGYSRAAFHAIQETVRNSDRKLPKGREEGAGVLYGTREGNTVRVQVARRISCEHARGQSFLLSASDRAALKEQLAREAAEPALKGLAIMGWFLSHTAPIRTAMTANGRTVLSSADLQTFDEYFGKPGQVTVVLRPHATTTMQASVFTRRGDGSVNAGDSDLNFPFTEAAAFTDRAKEVELKELLAPAPAVRETSPGGYGGDDGRDCLGSGCQTSGSRKDTCHFALRSGGCTSVCRAAQTYSGGASCSGEEKFVHPGSARPATYSRSGSGYRSADDSQTSSPGYSSRSRCRQRRPQRSTAARCEALPQLRLLFGSGSAVYARICKIL